MGLKGLDNDALATVNSIRNAVSDTRSAIRETNKLFKDQGMIAADISKDMSDITSSANKFKNVQDQAAKSSKATAEAIKQEAAQLSIVKSLNVEINALFVKSLTSSKKQSTLYLAQAQQLNNIKENAQGLAAEFGKLAQSSADIDKNTMWFSAFAEFTGDIKGLRTLSGPFDAAAKASRETVISNAKTKDIREKIGKLTKKEFNNTKKSGEGLTKERLKSLKLDDITQGNAGASASNMLKKYKSLNKIQSVGGAGLKAGFKALGPAISKAFVPLAIIQTVVAAVKMIIQALAAASVQAAKFSNNLLISRDAANELYTSTFKTVGEYNALADVVGRTTILQADFVKSLDAVNQLLGFQVNLLSDFGEGMSESVSEATMLQQNFGLSSELASRLVLESIKEEETLQDQVKTHLGIVGYLSAEEGLTADVTRNLEEASKVSGNLRANFEDSTFAIGEAIFNAKRLGFELNQMNGISNSLLSFQSSIESELAAELLTGKQLNLEKAREYALTGQTELLMKEVSREMGTQAEFLAMNFLQRQAIAKSIGLEANELADMYSKKAKNDALAEKSLKMQRDLKKQNITLETNKAGELIGSLTKIKLASEALGKSEKEIRETLGGQVYLRKQEESATQKFNKALAQAKEAFAAFVGDGSPLDALADILTGLTNSALFSGYAEAGAQRRSQKQTNKLLENKDLSEGDKASILKLNESAQKDSSTFFSSLLKKVLYSSVYKVTGGVMAELDDIQQDAAIKQSRKDIESLSGGSVANDFISRPGQPIQKFRADDVIVGGTGLGRGSGNQEVISLLKTLISTVQQGGDVFIDGNKVGKSLTLAASKMGG